MANSMDEQVITTAMMGVIESTLSKMNAIIATEPSQTKTLDIVEYDGRMRVSGIDKFNAPSYVSIVNYYFTQADLEKHRGAKGAMVLYVESENAGKFYKALGFSVAEDEDDASMMEANGAFGNLLGEGFKKELVNLGYADLVMSAPQNYRNSVMEGAEFSTDQKTKLEFSFFYWKHKSIVVELTLANIPLKK